MPEHKIDIDIDLKEAVARAEEAGKRRVEELSVRGDELKETLGRLVREARVRKITLVTHDGRTLAEIPLALGALGVLVIGPATAALLAGAWLARLSIRIEYEEAPAEVEKTPGEAIEQIEIRTA